VIIVFFRHIQFIVSLIYTDAKSLKMFHGRHGFQERLSDNGTGKSVRCHLVTTANANWMPLLALGRQALVGRVLRWESHFTACRHGPSLAILAIYMIISALTGSAVPGNRLLPAPPQVRRPEFCWLAILFYSQRGLASIKIFDERIS
jgi:hypothetical protein